jgi:hypothetical protein
MMVIIKFAQFKIIFLKQPPVTTAILFNHPDPNSSLLIGYFDFAGNNINQLPKPRVANID